MRLAAHAVLALIVSSGLLATVGHAAEAEALAVDAGFQPAALAPSLVRAADTQALKGLKRVAVPQFNVEFVTADNVSAQTSGFAMAGRASVTGFYKLVGVAEADFQAITEALYAGFVRELEASGLEVIKAADVTASPTWRKLVAAGTPLPIRSDSAVTVGPPGMAIYGLNRASAADGKKGLFSAFSMIGAGFGAVGAASENVALQQELGGAALLEVSMRVHFAQLADNNRGFFGRLSDTASVSAKVHPVVTNAKLAVQAGPVVNMLDVQRPLMLDPAAFTELRKEAKTTAEVAGAVAIGLLRAAIGNKDSHASESYEAIADPARYREHVGAGLARVNELFVARLAAAR
jgi:hypothetical protein